MANVYVDSNAVGTGTGANWANAYTTLNAALTAKAAGDSFWVAHNHVETTAAGITHTSPGSVGTPCFIYCVNSGGTVPPVSADLRTTATVSQTATNGILAFAGVAYCYGIIFKSGTAGNSASINLASANSSQWRWDSCGFTLNTTASGARLNFTNSGIVGGRIELRDCTFTFGSNVGQGFSATSSAVAVSIIGGTVVVGANVPASLFLVVPPLFDVIGLDMSAIGSGKTLVAASTSSGRTRFQDCRLGASVTVAATPTTLNQEVHLVRSDSGATNYRNEKYTYTGTETTETTIIRTGGASDGTTTWAKKIVTSANAKWILPFECIPFDVWVDSTGSHTVTVYGIWGGGAVPTTADMSMDVEYLGNGSYPRASFDRSTSIADNLAGGGNHSSDSSSWGGSTTAFKMVTGSFTANLKGWVRVYIKVYKATTTVYFDQNATVT